ncbi:SDR family oxidoreductase [Cryobacterium sp. TMT1-3]|uniref:SDR family oxidoreductase n=1 Tax=Cryobacterium luteum TaxID=1424661 RepID=A0A1H8ASS5_9MICO|nr:MULTISPECIES: SDR family oxidoreductase [Cryobacterium]TFB88604.1 SDR family oxidoreductase [Cryobacterium luteum]TFC24632.1 SDR family oxidoreductase [Cryobacterium sp. TMT1-3]SEM73014.1 cyclic-di-GMP-binding biofilm dispersal mediator protein [Cryobacterium luteum]
MTSLAGSSILVVGATGGLGREIAQILSAEGALLTLHGRTPERLASLGIAAARVTGDLLEPETAAQLVAASLNAHGRLDGVVNAAGVVAFGPMAEVSDDTIDTLMTVNATAPMRLLRAAYPALAESSGSHRDPFFLTLSGVVSESPTANMAAYSASKAALAAFAKAAGRELRRDGIRFLDARPGHTETGLATRPIQGSTPRLPAGFSPADVARRVVDAIVAGERDLPSTAFTS